MQISLHFFATYRQLVGERSIELEVEPQATVRMAIHQFLEKYPHMRRHWCDQEGNLMPHLFVIINKQDISSLPDGENTILQPGDELDFVPPVGGG
ncbi:MAG: MoaD family protein [Anaerolineaceae bacterium]|nr:MoaD family protein [Anaerolineaceae bacterium]